MKMTSERKIAANRANSRASTGPRTAQGRTHSARNALRHALSLPVYSDRALCAEVEALAGEIAGPDANAEMRELARRVAEAEVDLRRVRCARHRLLSRAVPGARIAGLLEYVTTTPEGSHKLATILSQEVQRLSALDRYERRALSRRKFAIRAFDLARGRPFDIAVQSP